MVEEAPCEARWMRPEDLFAVFFLISFHSEIVLAFWMANLPLLLMMMIGLFLLKILCSDASRPISDASGLLAGFWSGLEIIMRNSSCMLALIGSVSLSLIVHAIGLWMKGIVWLEWLGGLCRGRLIPRRLSILCVCGVGNRRMPRPLLGPKRGILTCTP